MFDGHAAQEGYFECVEPGGGAGSASQSRGNSDATERVPQFTGRWEEASGAGMVQSGDHATFRRQKLELTRKWRATSLNPSENAQF